MSFAIWLPRKKKSYSPLHEATNHWEKKKNEPNVQWWAKQAEAILWNRWFHFLATEVRLNSDVLDDLKNVLEDLCNTNLMLMPLWHHMFPTRILTVEYPHPEKQKVTLTVGWNYRLATVAGANNKNVKCWCASSLPQQLVVDDPNH